MTALAGGGQVTAPADAPAMLELYDALDAATQGAVNPLVGESLARRGYDAGYRLTDHGPLAAPARWREILRADGDHLTLSEPAVIDVGALGKGGLIDLVMSVLRDADCARGAVVDAGGDLAVEGTTERVALEHPYDTRRAIGVWKITDAALCASATNRRAWGEGLHHVLDARTGQPVRRYAATWALAGDAMTADAAATALFFDGGPRVSAERGVQWVRMGTDGRVEWSPGCTAEVFT